MLQHPQPPQPTRPAAASESTRTLRRTGVLQVVLGPEGRAAAPGWATPSAPPCCSSGWWSRR